MAFLRSQKFFRFLSVGKNLINFREYDVTHQIQPVSCVCSSQNNFATSANVRPVNLDSQLKRLDHDVRRSGRISRRDLEEILEEIRTNKTATSSQSLLVIRCCGNLVPEEKPEVRTKIVQEIWKTLMNLNVPMDISHYNALLRVYLENEYEFSPTEFLAELQSKGVEPNRVTYQRLIARYCQQGDIDGATQILEFMREKQLPVNENVFNALINGHANADDLESAVGIISVMSQAGLEPSADTYTTLLCGFARKGDIESIKKHIDICEGKEIHLLDKDLLEIVYSLAINGHEDKVESILEKVKRAPGYNQDSVNIILRLVNKNKVDTAMAILKTMPRTVRGDGEFTDAGSFLLKQLVKADAPVEKILKVAQELIEFDLHTKPFVVALEESLVQGKQQIAFEMLREMKKRSIEIREHYFWPLMASSTSKKNIFEIIDIMNKEFNIEVTGQAIRDYVLPKLGNEHYEKLVLTLRNIGVSPATSSTCVAFNAIKKNDLSGAARLMSSFDAYYSPGLFRKPVLNALIPTQDYENYAKILRAIYEGVPRLTRLNASQKREAEIDDNEGGIEADETPETRIEKLQGNIMGSFVLDALINIRANKLESVEKILESLVAQGLSITSSKAEQVQNYIGEKMTANISTLLGKLTSGELEPIPYERTQMKVSSNTPLSVDALERLITRIDEKGGNTKGMKKQLLIQAIRSKDLPKTEQLIEKLKADGYVIGSGVHALLFELYALNDKVDEAKQLLEQIKKEDPEFVLDDIKSIRYVHALVSSDRVDEAYKFLEDNKRDQVPDSNIFMYNQNCWRILNYFAEKGDVDNLNKMLDTLISNNFAIANNILLGPLIKIHVIKDEMKEAINKFEEICVKYRTTPWKNELACKLIQAEDAESLQRITDLSTDIHGEVNSLYDLVFSFIECGRIRQARKILETPGLRQRAYNRLGSICERFAENGKPSILEGLAEATKDLNHIDRIEIYNSLLQTYIKDKETEKCLEMWMKMQEEDITASDSFLIKLADFLESQGIAVPFTKPEPVVNKVEAKKEVKEPKPVKKTKESSNNAPIEALRQAIRTKNDSSIENYVQQNDYAKQFSEMTVFEKSKVIEALVRLHKLSEASELVFKMLAEKTQPRIAIFRFYLNRLATKGETDTIEKVGAQIDEATKKEVSFDNRLCHSFVSSGKIDDYVKRLENAIDSAKTEEEIKKVEIEFPRGGSIGLLEENPTIIDRFESIAKKYAEKNVIGPMNVLWGYHFTHGNEEKADKIFKEFLASAPRLMFHRVIQVARDNNDLQLANKLLSLLKNASHVSEGALGNVHSAIIDIQVNKGKTEEILSSIKSAVDNVCLENINRTALLRAKENVEKAGKAFPYKIPEKKTGGNQQDSSSSSSSSSSDDEVTRKN